MSRAEVLAAFGRFDAAHARCFLESDKQSLLSVLEAGFGSLDAFNEVIRHTFGGATAAPPGPGLRRADTVRIRATAGGSNLVRTHMERSAKKISSVQVMSRKSLV